MSFSAYDLGGLISSVMMWIFLLYSVWYFVRTKKYGYVEFGIVLGIFLVIMPGFFSMIAAVCIAVYDTAIKKKGVSVAP